MGQHGSARLSVHSRRTIAMRVLEEGWTITAAAMAANVSRQTASKWVGRFLSREAASYEERAIYWAARLMEARLEATLILLDPARITTGPVSRFRFHGFATKHLRIYRHQFEEKDLRMRVMGQSYGYLNGNSAAIGIIPHAFIDNAYKYAPPASEVVVQFQETDTSISMTVASYGPVIHEDEVDVIFDPLVRGKEARALEAGGTGIGLALASAVARNIGASIEMRQDPSRTHGVLVWTAFTATFRRVEQRTATGRG